MAAFLAGSAVFVAAGYSAYQVAPAAAEPPSSFGGHFLATLWFLPRVLFWQPTWGVAALFALSGGEQGCCWRQRRVSHALHIDLVRLALHPLRAQMCHTWVLVSRLPCRCRMCCPAFAGPRPGAAGQARCRAQ